MSHTSPDASLIKSTGGFGSIFVTDDSRYTGSFFAIKAISDCVFGELSCQNMENVEDWVSSRTTLYAGDVLSGGNFTVVSLSGKAILFKH